jgi:hypothetical protein
VPQRLSTVFDTDMIVGVASEASSWRQYVPLVVSSFVLLDIVLGSPAANSLIRLTQQQVDDQHSNADSNTQGNESTTAAQTTLNSVANTVDINKPRIDVDAVVKQALDKADNVKMLRSYLEENKTDWDRMEDIRREQDRLMDRLDNRLMDE